MIGGSCDLLILQQYLSNLSVLVLSVITHVYTKSLYTIFLLYNLWIVSHVTISFIIMMTLGIYLIITTTQNLQEKVCVIQLFKINNIIKLKIWDVTIIDTNC